MKAQGAFTARECFALSLDRLYRVYSSGGELVFVKLGGQAGFGRGAASVFGVAGVLVYRWLEKRAQARLAAEVAAMDRRDLRGLLARDEANFRLRVAEVVSSTIEPPSGFHAPHVGKWRLQASDGTTHQFQFEDVEEMKAAIGAMQALLGEVQQVNVRWDGTQGKYVQA